MTTPSTSAVRAWAREQGISVAERGRLPAELRDAYLAAQAGGKPAAKKAAKATAKTTVEAPADKAPAKKAPAKTAPAKKAAAKAPAKKASPAPKPVAKRAAPRTAAIAPVEAEDATPLPLDVPEPVAAPEPAPGSPEQVEARFVRLEERVKALAARVDVLEQPPAQDKPRRFRRR